MCDPVVKELGFVDRVTALLDTSEIISIIFDQVIANPTDILVHKIADIASSNNIDALVAIGGGSVIDAAKATSILLSNKGHISAFHGFDKVLNPTLPLIMIPTTSGTASEITSVTVISDTKNHRKMVIGGNHVGGDVAICDPSLTEQLPPSITAATGMDALTHAIEAYVSKCSSPVTDTLALRAIELIIENIEDAFGTGCQSSRANMMLGSSLAGMAFNSASLGLVHSLAHPFSAHYDTPHGVANAIFLPHVVEYNMCHLLDKRRPLAIAMGISLDNKDEMQLGCEIVSKLEHLSQCLDIPSLASIGVPKEDIPMLAEEAFYELSTLTNPRNTSIEEIISILNIVMNK